MSDAPAAVVDVAFSLQGQTLSLPRDHRRALAAALAQALPWLATEAGAGVHRLNVSAGGGAAALLSQRTRLTLRLPRHRVADAVQLSGQTLQVSGAALPLGAAQVRELVPHSTLYAHLVAADTADELAFLQAVQAQTQSLEVACRPICGRHQTTEAGTLQGFSLMLDGLNAAHALRLLETGIGTHRLWGCGLFVPHKSAAAVGAPH
jgi:CRISPR-associated protein Cas6